MNDLLKRSDTILENLIGLAESHMNEAVKANHFSKDFSEGMAIVLSVVYEREKMRDGK